MGVSGGRQREEERGAPAAVASAAEFGLGAIESGAPGRCSAGTGRPCEYREARRLHPPPLPLPLGKADEASPHQHGGERD